MHWLRLHERIFLQVGFGSARLDTEWLTRCRALPTLDIVSTAWPTAPCRRSVTRATTVLLTRRASSTHTTLHSSPTRPTLSSTTLGAGTAPPSPSSLERHHITDNDVCTEWFFLFCTDSVTKTIRCKAAHTTDNVVYLRIITLFCTDQALASPAVGYLITSPLIIFAITFS